MVKKVVALEEEMEIKVGSEWVDKDGNKVKVLFSSNKTVVIDDEFESCNTPDEFTRTFKPAPVRRTVWLNVHDYGTYSYETKEIADNWKREDMLFQQEVELIDPREGEKK